MKKRIVALVALAAMLLTMLPVSAFAASEDINITVASFNNNIEQNENVLVLITGSDVEKNMRVVCYQEGVADAIYTGIVAYDGEDTIYIPKSKIKNLDDMSAKNKITINVQSADGSKVYASKTVSQEYVATMPASMKVTLDNADGTQNRVMTVTFDSKYIPDSDDRLCLQSIDANGKAGTSQYITVPSLTKGDDGSLYFKKNISKFDTNAAKVRVTFERDGELVDTLSQTLSLTPSYGTLDHYEFDFGGSVIVRGETTTGKLYYVNTDGKKYDVTSEDGMLYTFNNEELIDGKVDNTKPDITLKDDATVGAKVRVVAIYNNNVVATTDLTVVDNIETGKVLTNRSSYNAGEEAGIEFTLVNSSGNAMKLDFFPTNIDIRWIDSSVSDPGFKVNLTDHGASLTSKGTLLTSLQCDKPCTGKFEITFTDDKGHAYQVVSDTFTFKDPDAKAQKVELTIGSTAMKVDGTTVTMNVAPLIYQDRTFVPLRAVAQAFGGDVNFDNDSRVITIKLGSTTMIMTPGSQSYTVNGKAKTTDAAPYIIADAGRTMVPFRVIGEELGYDVEAISRPDGTTSGVVFEAK